MNNCKIYTNMSDNKWLECGFDATNIAQEIFTHVISNTKLDIFANNDISNKTIVANLELANDDEVCQLNNEFRGINKPTNILSFANIDDNDFLQYICDEDEIELGDMIIAFETMLAQSIEAKISLHDHFAHILTHGVLHLLGYDHIDNEDAQKMEDIETKLLEKINIKNPYEERE